MLGLSWTEMLVIGVVALIFIGPKDLPVVMGRIGKVVGQIRRMGTEFQREINRTTGLDEVRNLRSSITDPLKKSADEIRREFNAMTPTGPKPSGAIKPADPKAESVVDELRSAAGMPPAPKKTNDEIAAEAGFKPTQPVKAAQVSPAPSATPAPTAPVASSDLPAVEGLTPSGKPRAPRAPVKTEAAEVAAEPVAKKPRASRAKTVSPAEVVATEKPAAKPRAPRKKPADPAEKN
ncbi:MAG: twin-arginine translocase subunit TatB [Devosia sp.]|uniref:Sec-independent protein translocase protein TatB n=1 Tax=Devosia sp. TaxID=1871048 RepID=UPI0019E4FDDA|nr:Sec-independent protein translocase protein TatB [Devosia sp.]MBF0678024.1 twin-arginine translocase subunit TatB [Devosia sp.]